MENKIENFFCVLGNCICIGCVILSLLRREYLSSAVNLLGNGKGAVVEISLVFVPIYHVACRRVL